MLKGTRFTVTAIALGVATAALANSNFISRDLKKFQDLFFHKKSVKNHVDLLFMQQAQSGQFVALPGHTACKTLVLTGLRPELHYFSDQPKHVTGKLTTKDFMQVWAHNGGDNHFKPNVALEGIALANNSDTEVDEIATLSNPRFHPNSHSMSYVACPMAGKKLAQTAHLKQVTVFFDAFHQWPP